MLIKVSSKNKLCTIHLELHSTGGNGLCGYLYGGAAHVGAVAYAVPRPKSSGDGITADISSICGPGHKDIYAAQKVAERLCLRTNETACICAGIHLGGAARGDIEMILTCCLEVADLAVEKYMPGKEVQNV